MEEGCQDTVALLSAEAGRHLYDRRLSDLIGDCPPEATNSCPVGRPDAAQIHSTESSTRLSVTAHADSAIRDGNLHIVRRSET